MPDNFLDMSPLQLKQLVFGRVHVEAVSSSRLPEDPWAPTFDLGDVLIQASIDVFPQASDNDKLKRYVVVVVFKIPNAKSEEVVAPYTIDVEAQALIEMAALEDEKRGENLVRVNGGSMIIGAIREQVTQLTARSIYGPLTLPTLRILPQASSGGTTNS